MVCQPRVCMRMRNTKYFTLEVASKQASISFVLDYTVKHHPLIFLKHLIHYKTAGALLFLFTPCMECCNCLRIPLIDREESNVRKHKRITMAQ